MMKKWIATVLAVTFLAAGVSAAKVEAATKIVRSDMPIEVLYDARKIVFDVKPKMVSGSVLVPIRFVSDKLGGQLAVNGKEITIVKGDRTLKLTMNSRSASFNGKAVTLAQPAMVENGRTLVPLRAVSEGLGTAVEWDGVNQFVWIGHKDIPDIHDAVPAEDFEPYLPYYKGFEFFSENNYGKTRTKVHLVKDSDLPIKIRSYYIYRIDKAFDSKGDSYIRFSTTLTGSLGLTVPFLKKGEFKVQQEASYLLESLENKVRIRYVSLNDRKTKVDLNKTDYFSIPEDIEGAVLFKNKWRS
ncbi:copper amine oxidase N-terminal domain-containing protein [Paenibacillus sp. 1P07SE]|uniref:copper amine oxidase N-terminal domain-containing protein n=1 Tax=Paenibacillus sp. 1P07SE TaxID=3132209 RepID=UPI0039A67E78